MILKLDKVISLVLLIAISFTYSFFLPSIVFGYEIYNTQEAAVESSEVNDLIDYLSGNKNAADLDLENYRPHVLSFISIVDIGGNFRQRFQDVAAEEGDGFLNESRLILSRLVTANDSDLTVHMDVYGDLNLLMLGNNDTNSDDEEGGEDGGGTNNYSTTNAVNSSNEASFNNAGSNNTDGWRDDMATIDAINGKVTFYTRNLTIPTGDGRNENDGYEWIISRIEGDNYSRLLLMVMGGNRDPSRILLTSSDNLPFVNGAWDMPLTEEAKWEVYSENGTLIVELNDSQIWNAEGNYTVERAIMNGYSRRGSTGEWRLPNSNDTGGNNTGGNNTGGNNTGGNNTGGNNGGGNITPENIRDQIAALGADPGENDFDTEDVLRNVLEIAGSATLGCAVVAVVGGLLTNLVTKLGEALASSVVSLEVPIADHGLRGKEVGSGPFNMLPSSDTIVVCILNKIIEELLRATIEWTKNGFEGNPFYLLDPDEFARQLSDQLAMEYLNDLLGEDAVEKYLCQKWEFEVVFKLLLEQKSPQRKLGCTVEDVINSVGGTLDNFTGGEFSDNGSWQALFEITQKPENTPNGALKIAGDQLFVAQSALNNTLTLELGWSDGFLSVYDEETNTNVSPGTILGYKVARKLNLSEDRLTFADEFDELLTEVINTVMAKAFDKVFRDGI